MPNEFKIKNGLLVDAGGAQVTGSLIAPSITGSLEGTASWAFNVSTASFVTGSAVNGPLGSNSVLSSSYALTASFALNAGGASAITVADEGTAQGTATFFNFTGAGVTATVSSNTASINIPGGAGETFPYTGSAIISGSLQVTGSVSSTGGFTGSLLGTSSWAQNAVTASYITASNVYGPFGSNSVLSASYSLSSSNSVSASYSQTASYGINIVISGSISNADYIQFNTSASVTDAVGRLYFDQGEGVLQYALNGNNVVARIGEDLYQYAYNAEGSPMTKGQVVYISGSQGNRIAVKLASNNAEQGSSNVLGFVAENIAAGSDGWVQTNGVLRKLNTLGLTAGQLIFLSATPGAYTQTFPQAPSHSVRLGFPERIDNTVGSIYIKIDNGYELEELHDVAVNSVSSGDLLVRSGSIWINSKQLTGSYGLTGSLTALGSLTLTGSLNITGSTVQIGNNTLLGNTTLSGSITISGSTTPGSPTASVQIYGDIRQSGYHRFDPVTTNIDTSVSASYIYVSGSTNDLYFSQNGQGYANTTRLRWLEGNLYTGLLNGGIISATLGTNTYTIGSGSGIVVTLNASYNDNPYPTVQYVNWGNLVGTIDALSASYDQSFVAVLSNGTIGAQGTPYNDGDYNTKIPIGIVLHQNRSTINAFQTFPGVAYGWKQRSFDFIKAFGPLKISGYTLSPSGSSTGSLVLSGGTAWVDGRNYTVDPSNPSYITEGTGITTSKIFRYYQSGSGWVYNTNAGAGYATIDPTNYSLNGVLTPVDTNKWTIQRVYYFPNSATKAFYIYYGNAEYANETEALAAVSTEPFSEAPNTAANAIYVGFMLLRYNADFTVPASYEIYEAGLFRASGAGGAGGGGGATALTQLTDVSITSPTDYQPFAYNSVTTKWENRSTISASLKGNADTATTASHAQTASSADAFTVRNFLELLPGTDPGTANISASYLFVTSSSDDTEFNLHYRNNGALWETHWLEQVTNTGLVWGGVLTFTASLTDTPPNATQMRITPGAGLIINHNANTASHEDTIPTYVPFGPITASAQFITSSQVTYLLIDENGQLVQQTTQFTPEQYVEKFPLGYIFCLTTSSISSYADARVTTYGQAEQEGEFVRAFGPLKLSGYDITAQSGSLKVSIASGQAYRYGGFYSQNPQSPSIYDSTAVPTGSLVRIYRDPSVTGGFKAQTNAGLPFTDIDPTKWDDGSGTLQTVGASEWSIQRVFQGVVNGVSYVYYGQNVYSSLALALQSITTDQFVESPTSILALPFIGYVIVKGDATDIGDTTNNRIIQAGLFRNTAGSSGGGGAAAQSLDDLSDVSVAGASNGQALVYSSGLWINGNPASASYAFTASYVLQAVSSSFASTASFVTLAQTASFVATASWANNAVTASYVTASNVYGPFGSNSVLSASFALSASWAPGGNVTFPEQFFTTSSYAPTSQSLEPFIKSLGTVNLVSESISITGSNTLFIQDYGPITLGTLQEFFVYDSQNSKWWNVGTNTVDSDTLATIYSVQDLEDYWTNGAFNQQYSSWPGTTGDYEWYTIKSFAKGAGSTVFGSRNLASGSFSFVFGIGNKAYGIASFARGYQSIATGDYSSADGFSTQATGLAARSEGQGSQATGPRSHAEGQSTIASGPDSHAEGNNTQANGDNSHTEGSLTIAQAESSHAEGIITRAYGPGSHAEGLYTEAWGTGSHTEGIGSLAYGDYQTIVGSYNITSSEVAAFIVGNGTNVTPSNLLYAAGTQVQVTGSVISTGGFTGSLEGTASWAQNAVTASFVTSSNVYGPYGSNSILSASFAVSASWAPGGSSGLKTKAGSVANTSFTGNPKKATVTFAGAFSDTSYAIVVTGEDSRTWTIESKLAGSFVINANSNTGLSGTTYWVATAYGETA